MEIDLTTKDFSPEIGNILKSTQTLSIGETILKERPLIVGPNHVEIPVCLECCLACDNDQCSNCSWALCKACQAMPSKKWHCNSECELLKTINQSPFYPLVFPLRLIQEALADSETWQKLKNLQDHVDQKSSSEEWQVFENQVKSFFF